MIGLRSSSVVAVLLLTLPVVAADPLCDLTGDGNCDFSDIDLLGESLGSDDPLFDLNGDGATDLGDRDEWLLTAGIQNGFGGAYLLGDATFDGKVDAADKMTIGLNWQAVGVSYSDGDFNMDDEVNAIDLNSVGINWQKSISFADSSGRISPIPEPSGALLWFVLFLGVWCGGRQNRCIVVLFSVMLAAASIHESAHGQICDLDGDADCDVDDIDQLSLGLQMPFDAKYDLNGDGEFAMFGGEFDFWLDAAGEANGFAGAMLWGDANLDGTVNVVDLNVVGQRWLQTGATWSTGDFNADGEVNAIDLMRIGANWQSTVRRSNVRATVSVPEPASYLLGFLCVLGFREVVRRFPAKTVSIALLAILWVRR